jgi:phosphate transport system substrate-binding protein
MKNLCWMLLPILGAVAQAVFASESVKLNGAASVVDSLVGPHKDAVEKATGCELIVDKSNAGRGLADLCDGMCDAAMTSASLEATVQAAKSAGLAHTPPDLQMHVIKKSEVVFIVHPSNAVKSLSWEQIRDIHTGLVTCWKDVGGEDRPVTVYTDSKASATRGLIKQTVMGGREYAADSKAVDFVKQVNDRVAQDAGGIGGLGLSFVDPDKVSIIKTEKVERPLGFITIGEPSEKVRKVIATFKVEGNK